MWLVVYGKDRSSEEKSTTLEEFSFYRSTGIKGGGSKWKADIDKRTELNSG